jgi:pimeloyl-ACP methyl ester carboxylesterase
MKSHQASGSGPSGVARHLDVRISAGHQQLEGDLTIPPEPTGLVLFAHGSGSSRKSPRNLSVARTLQDAGMGTLLFDLLTDSEAANRSKVFDIVLLAKRLATAASWCRHQGELSSLPQGYFGASTGAAAALVAAADDAAIRAVVSRGGRPDLAGQDLAVVKAPTLLIVGGSDWPVIPLNEQALEQLTCLKRLVIVPGATHLFEEPGTLEEVSRLAAGWFANYLRRP